MKLVPQLLVSSEFAKLRQRPETSSSKPVEPVDAIVRAKPLGSYESAAKAKARGSADDKTLVNSAVANSAVANSALEKQPATLNPSALPREYSADNSRAVSYYAYTASLVADGGELIGIDTYA